MPILSMTSFRGVAPARRCLPYILLVSLLWSVSGCVGGKKASIDGGASPVIEPDYTQHLGQDTKEPSLYEVLGKEDPNASSAEISSFAETAEVLDLAIPLSFEDGTPLTAEERRALLTVSDLDRHLNVTDYDLLMPYFKFYLHRSRVTIKHMVKNAEPYLPFVRKVFKENGIPEELAYLAMIESVYRPKAVSPAGAAGVWQFMPGTGKAYGLRSNWWIDERRDTYKATLAAAKYLNVLYGYFGDWLLAITAYNAGEGTVLRALKETNTDNFFSLVHKRSRLKEESKRYAPSFLAVTKIMRNLELLGFDDFDLSEKKALVAIQVPSGTDLLALSKEIGMTWADFAERNAAFRRYVSPSDGPSTVYVDKAHEALVMDFLSHPQKHYAGWKPYKVKKGDTLGHIAYKYGVPVSVLSRVNDVSPTRLRIGSTIMVPAAMDKANTTAQRPHSTGGNYEVQKGDTLYDIAHTHGVSLNALMTANGLNKKSRLGIGQRLTIPKKGGNEVETKPAKSTPKKEQAVAEVKPQQERVAKTKAEKPTSTASKPSSTENKALVHVVKKGDTLYSIARQYNTKIDTLMRINGVASPKALKLNQRLTIPTATAHQGASAPTASEPSARNASDLVQNYVVQAGDTIWSIARRFNLTANGLLEQNGMTRQTILHPGDILKVTQN